MSLGFQRSAGSIPVDEPTTRPSATRRPGCQSRGASAPTRRWNGLDAPQRASGAHWRKPGGDTDLYVSAGADALVGAICTTCWPPGGGRVIVGDVRGKGLPAVHIAAAVLSAFRHTAHGTGIDVARAVEQAVSPQLDPEDFVTSVFCDVDSDGRFDVALCGHPSPLRLTHDGVPQAVGTHRSPPLGLGLGVRVETTP